MIELRMHDGWHIPSCPSRNCSGHQRVVSVNLDELAEYRVKDTQIVRVKKFTCGHEHEVIIRP